MTCHLQVNKEHHCHAIPCSATLLHGREDRAPQVMPYADTCLLQLVPEDVIQQAALQHQHPRPTRLSAQEVFHTSAAPSSLHVVFQHLH